MKRICATVAFVSCFAWQGANADAQVPVEQLTIEGVKRYVADHEIHSIEALMDELPPVLKDTFALMEDSHSRQRPATTRQPRIIMFLPDGKFFLTVATHPRSNAFDQVEMLEFTPEAQWNLDLIPFPSGSTDYLGRLPAADGCERCHGAHKRPIWGAYDEWYGAFADNAGQFLTDRQARKLTEVLARNDEVRIGKLGFRDHRVWQDRESFNLPAYHDSSGVDLMNDAIIARHTEHLWKRSLLAENYALLLVAYFFLDDREFLEQVSDEDLPLVRDAKDRLRLRLQDLYRQSGTQHRGDDADRALRLLGLDPYADLFVMRSTDDLNPDYRDEERYIDQNFSTGGDHLDAWIGLLIVNWMIARQPAIEEHFQNTPYVGDGDFATVNDYRKRLSWWAWEATLDQRVELLRTKRHLAGLLRTKFLLPPALQARAARSFVDLANEVLGASRPAK
jgi:hypothetical protein